MDIENLLSRSSKIIKHFDKENLEKEKLELESELSTRSIWEDYQLATKKSKRLSKVSSIVDNLDLLELYIEAKEHSDLNELVDNLEKELYLSGEFDDHSCFLTVMSGAGGTEAMDWAGMLLRMYTRYCENNGYKVELIYKQNGEEAGIKTATVRIDGDYAYGYFKNEKGTHRLVRLSPFNAKNLRQTSFAGVEVIPVIENDNHDIEIPDSEVKIDTFKSSGAGGQSVNTTDSAVRIKHIPTGIVVSCQQERNQIKNKDLAMQLLKSKLLIKKEEERKIQEAELKGVYKEAGWGNQIRNYVLHPYKLVKDLRSNFEHTNPEKVLDGDLHDFLQKGLGLVN